MSIYFILISSGCGLPARAYVCVDGCEVGEKVRVREKKGGGGGVRFALHSTRVFLPRALQLAACLFPSARAAPEPHLLSPLNNFPLTHGDSRSFFFSFLFFPTATCTITTCR